MPSRPLINLLGLNAEQGDKTPRKDYHHDSHKEELQSQHKHKLASTISWC